MDEKQTKADSALFGSLFVGAQNDGLFIIDKRPFVKFHAAQSIAMSVGLMVVYFALGIVFAMLHFVSMGFLALAIWPLLGLLVFVLWIFMMYKAYQHEKFKLPIIGDIAEKMAGN